MAACGGGQGTPTDQQVVALQAVAVGPIGPIFEVVLVDHFMAEALHRLINEGDRFAETRGVMRR